MPRRKRIRFAGAVQHVTMRGNGGELIFFADPDCYGFLVLLTRVAARHGWIVHAFCLMGNHVHLVIETPEPNLSEGMRELAGGYARRFNAAHRRRGHLFGERYKAVLVHRETHLKELARYVVLNPVRAGLCRSAADWPWSSYAATAGLAGAPPFLRVDWLLAQFDEDPGRAGDVYRRFVDEGAARFHEAKGMAYAVADAPLAV